MSFALAKDLPSTTASPMVPSHPPPAPIIIGSEESSVSSGSQLAFHHGLMSNITTPTSGSSRKSSSSCHSGMVQTSANPLVSNSSTNLATSSPSTSTTPTPQARNAALELPFFAVPPSNRGSVSNNNNGQLSSHDYMPSFAGSVDDPPMGFFKSIRDGSTGTVMSGSLTSANQSMHWANAAALTGMPNFAEHPSSFSANQYPWRDGKDSGLSSKSVTGESTYGLSREEGLQLERVFKYLREDEADAQQSAMERRPHLFGGKSRSNSTSRSSTSGSLLRLDEDDHNKRSSPVEKLTEQDIAVLSSASVPRESVFYSLCLPLQGAASPHGSRSPSASMAFSRSDNQPQRGHTSPLRTPRTPRSPSSYHRSLRSPIIVQVTPVTSIPTPPLRSNDQLDLTIEANNDPVQ